METIELVYSPFSGEVVTHVMPYQKEETIKEALNRSGFLEKYPLICWDTHKVSIYGKKAALDAWVSPEDRIEVLRPLTVDPKEARRLRAVKQANAKK